MKPGAQKQLFYIHGGDSYASYDDFLTSLKTWPIERLRPGMWRSWAQKLPENLPHFQVFTPAMPNKQNAQYEEWKIWFERHFELLNQEVILVGYSLGGMFLAKYVVENPIPFTVRALFLIGAPCGTITDGTGNTCDSFSFDSSEIGRLIETIPRIVLLHSKDDPVVPYEHVVTYKKYLPNAELVTFTDRNHFLQEEFPELLALIHANS